jgi:hypothetical protein
VLSFGPGTEVYAIWGHTAIRVKDPVLGIDQVFNYGTFDFDTPNFTLKFIRGKLDYTLSIQKYRRVIAAYKREKRWISEQTLNLNLGERNHLYALLLENYKPENRYYKYDFLFDNCATRPLEIIEKSIADTIVFSTTVEQTYRDILDEHLVNTPWLDLGIDLIIGSLADDLATARQQMFMPVYILRYFDSGIRKGANDQPLVARKTSISTESGSVKKSIPFILKPVFIFLLLLVLEIILIFFTIKRKKILLKFYDHIWFGLVFLGSLLILFLWFGTDHIPTKFNWNAWWMNPLYLLLMPFIKSALKSHIAKALFFITLLFLIGWFLIPQQFHPAVLPIVGILGIKTYKYGFLKLN